MPKVVWYFQNGAEKLCVLNAHRFIAQLCLNKNGVCILGDSQINEQVYMLDDGNLRSAARAYFGA